MKRLIILVIILSCVQATAQIRLLSYNLLNFPTSNLAGRVDTLQNIIEYTRPHLLMIQELKTAEGLEDISDMMNDLNYGDFTHPDFISQQSPGSPSNQLQQAIVYDANVFRLKNSSVVLTNYRDINEYVLYLNDPQLPNGSDTTFLYVYVTHLKSSTGSDNEQARLEMVNYLIDHFETLPDDSNVIFSGDFNLYNNAEPAYIAMMSEENDIVLRDPFESYGNWAGSSFNHKEILTQCTRTNVIFDDGAGGGVDDRFDFILFSESLMNNDNPIHFIENSFLSIGNNGMCYNQSITDCDTGNPVPYDVLQSIYYMSDHIPQYCELATDLISTIPKTKNENAGIQFISGNIIDEVLRCRINFQQHQSLNLTITDESGRIIHIEKISGGNQEINISTQSWNTGIYFISVTSPSHQITSEKFAIIR